jgi:hypothetical protein
MLSSSATVHGGGSGSDSFAAVQWNSIYNVAYLFTSIDLPSVFKIDKIQDQSISTMYLTVCMYSH